jgi:hypothetical protein
MMCVCIAVTPERQDDRVSTADGDETTECEPESTSLSESTHDEVENSDTSTGGYHSKFQASTLSHG